MKPALMYGVYDNGVDGRVYPGKLKSIWSDESAAKSAAGVYYTTAPLWCLCDAHPIPARYYILVQPFPVLIGVDLDEEKEKRRAAALAKLDPEERALLGVE